MCLIELGLVKSNWEKIVFLVENFESEDSFYVLEVNVVKIFYVSVYENVLSVKVVV